MIANSKRTSHAKNKLRKVAPVAESHGLSWWATGRLGTKSDIWCNSVNLRSNRGSQLPILCSMKCNRRRFLHWCNTSSMLLLREPLFHAHDLRLMQFLRPLRTRRRRLSSRFLKGIASRSYLISKIEQLWGRQNQSYLREVYQYDIRGELDMDSGKAYWRRDLKTARRDKMLLREAITTHALVVSSLSQEYIITCL